MNGDQSAAALAFATMLQEQMMPNVEVPVESETAPEQEQTVAPQEDVTPRVDELEGQFKDFQKEMKKMIKDEIGGLKKEIQSALETDDEKK